MKKLLLVVLGGVAAAAVTGCHSPQYLAQGSTGPTFQSETQHTASHCAAPTEPWGMSMTGPDPLGDGIARHPNRASREVQFIPN